MADPQTIDNDQQVKFEILKIWQLSPVSFETNQTHPLI